MSSSLILSLSLPQLTGAGAAGTLTSTARILNYSYLTAPLSHGHGYGKSIFRRHHHHEHNRPHLLQPQIPRNYCSFGSTTGTGIFSGPPPEPFPLSLASTHDNLDNLGTKFSMLTLGQLGNVGPIGNHHQPQRLRLPIGIPTNQSTQIIPYESPTRTNIHHINPEISEIPTGKIIDDITPLPQSSIIEKRAARLVVIRRIKMNKHKLRKLRKRMKYVWAKMKLRKEIRKEKQFLNEQMDKVRAAQKFDPKEYVRNILQEAKYQPEPTHWNWEWIPPDLMKERLAKKMKREREEYLSILDKRDSVSNKKH